MYRTLLVVCSGTHQWYLCCNQACIWCRSPACRSNFFQENSKRPTNAKFHQQITSIKHKAKALRETVYHKLYARSFQIGWGPGCRCWAWMVSRTRKIKWAAVKCLHGSSCTRNGCKYVCKFFVGCSLPAWWQSEEKKLSWAQSNLMPEAQVCRHGLRSLGCSLWSFINCPG